MSDPRDRLDEWQRLADEATPGPWSVGNHDHIQGASHCECRSSYGPLVWEGRRDINGTKMLTHIHRRETRTWDDTSIYSTELPYPKVVALSTSEYVSISPEDAEFIAASRTAVPALLDAVQAVLDPHQPEWGCGNPSHTNLSVDCPECFLACACGDDVYPCQTVRAITDSLNDRRHQ